MNRFCFVFALAFGIAANSASAEGMSKSYSLPNNVAFRLHVPEGWRDQVRQDTHNLPPTISFAPESGAPFEVLATAIWIQPGLAMFGADEMRNIVENSAKGVASQAVEEKIEIRELKGIVDIGYYFSVTDKAPKPDEYKYLTQGVMGVRDIVFTFTILTNDGQEDIVTKAISMLASVDHPAQAEISY
jgi:hypothetical protein